MSLFDACSLPGGRLAGHQEAAVQWAVDRESAIIADPPGTGKTAIAAAVIGSLLPYADSALWVTEAHLRPQAMHELKRFLPTTDVTDDLLLTQSGHAPSVTVVSYEGLRHPMMPARKFDLVVFDEASNIKGSGSEAVAAAAVATSASFRLALTATPMEIDPSETYRILRLLGVAELPEDEDDFIERFCTFVVRGRGLAPTGLRRSRLEELRELFAPHILRRDIADIGLSLPAVRDEFLWVPLTAAEQRGYDRAGLIRHDLSRHHARDAASRGVAGRAAKVDAALAFLLSSSKHPKAVLFAEHHSLLNIAEQHFTDAGLGWTRVDGPTSARRRVDAVTAFKQDPETRVLLGTRVLERGLDGLQHCDLLLSLGSTYNPAREEQRIGRLRRPGSPHLVVTHLHVLADTPLERHRWRVVERRAAEAASVLDCDDLERRAIP